MLNAGGSVAFNNLLKDFFLGLILFMPFCFSLFPFYKARFSLIPPVLPISNVNLLFIEWLYEITGFGYLSSLMLVLMTQLLEIELNLLWTEILQCVFMISIVILNMKQVLEVKFTRSFQVLALFMMGLVSYFSFSTGFFIIGLIIQLAFLYFTKLYSTRFYISNGAKTISSRFYVSIFTKVIWRNRKIRVIAIFYAVSKISAALIFTFWKDEFKQDLANPVIWGAAYMIFLPFFMSSFFLNIWSFLKDIWLITYVNGERSAVLKFLYVYSIAMLPFFLFDLIGSYLWLLFVGQLSWQIIILGIGVFALVFWAGFFSSLLFAHDPEQEPLNLITAVFPLIIMLLWFAMTYALIDRRSYWVYPFLLLVFFTVSLYASKWFDKNRYSIFLKLKS
jgi:hypothetical protein